MIHEQKKKLKLNLEVCRKTSCLLEKHGGALPFYGCGRPSVGHDMLRGRLYWSSPIQKELLGFEAGGQNGGLLSLGILD